MRTFLAHVFTPTTTITTKTTTTTKLLLGPLSGAHGKKPSKNTARSMSVKFVQNQTVNGQKSGKL